jgi:DNA-binding NarL/FixJ family response regulator
MNKIRVFVADDHEMVRERVCSTLAGEFHVAGAVKNGQDAVAGVRRLDPDVLVIDISMPVLSGLEAVAQLGTNLRTKVVFLTCISDADFVSAAFEAGAAAYVLKSELCTDLLPAIREAHQGRRYLSGRLAGRAHAR